MARPRKELSEKEIKMLELLGGMHAPLDEIAAVFDISKRTIDRRYGNVLKKGKAKFAANMRMKMASMALQGNVTMLIWLSKQYLGMSDKFAVGAQGDGFEFVQP